MNISKAGFSILELSITLLISTIIAIIILKEIKLTNSTLKKLETEHKTQQTKNRLLALINPKTTGSWSAFNKIKVSTAADLTKIYPHLKIQNESYVISFLDFYANFYLVQVKENPNLFCLKILDKELLPVLSKLNYLLFSKQSWKEAEIKLTKKKSSSCNTAYEIKSYNIYDSPFNFKNQLEDFILLPIRNSFSVFVDQNQTLRRLEHQSLNNQPIEYGVAELNLKTEDNFIIGQLKIENSKRSFYLKNDAHLSSLELYASLKELAK